MLLINTCALAYPYLWAIALVDIFRINDKMNRLIKHLLKN